MTRDQARAVFGQVMGLVALTLATTALGAYISRNMTGSNGLLFFIGVFACMFGLRAASVRGHEQLAIGLLFGMGLLLGLAFGPVLAFYAKAQPSALWQASAATGGFVAALGSYGYATRRDLSSWYRTLFWALIGLIAFGVVTLFISIPNSNIIYCLGGLAIFGAFTIFDFNRLRRADMNSSVMIAAGIFLDVFNIFIFFLSLFGGGSRR